MDGERVLGSCLCGSVRFEVALPFDYFLLCHCSRCRKATGTAHAANAVVRPEAFAWTGGEDLVRRYDLPTAESFSTGFCGQCGGPVPHLTRSGRRVIVPAGCFDDDPGTIPSAQAHWMSRAPWYRHGDEIPTVDDDLF